MNENKKYKGNIITIVVAFCIALAIVASGTYAYWIWQSTVNKDVVFNTTSDIEDYVVYNEGETKIIGNFQPTSTFCESTSTTLYFYKKEATSASSPIYDVSLTATINLDVNSIGTNIAASSDVYWVLTTGDADITCTDGLSSTAVVNSGTFNGVTAGTTIALASDIDVTTAKQTYTVWIWIDAAGTDLSNLAGETIDTNIWTQIDMAANEPEAPVLDSGMIPVIIANDGTVTTVSENALTWYDYSEQKWANVILVTDSSRSTYKNTNGVTVSEEDILAYYTWIPRYRYVIPQTKCSDIPEEDRNMEDYPECYAPYTMSDTDKTKLVSYFEAEEYCGGSDEYSSSSEIAVNYALENGRFTFSQWYDTSIVAYVNAYNNGESNDCGLPDGTTLTLTASEFNGNNSLLDNETSIDIEFETATSSVSNGDAKNTYKTHPAFIWDGETIAGIWVGKFETSTDTSSTCYTTANTTNCNNTTQSPRVLPNVYSLRYQYIGNQFTTSQKFSASDNIYGLSNTTTDAHMMKNSEWGAVAYLSHSIYGINEGVRINNNSSYTTGCSASTANGSSSSTCEIAYGGATSYPQSTTGNITGVFDMSGGTWEYVMGNYDNTAHSTYIPTLPDSKYYDVYLASQFTGMNIGNMALCTLDTCGGHALNETAGWYDDYAHFVGSDYPWFIRGGRYGSGTDAGVFLSDYANGNAGGSLSWRSVLITSDAEITQYTITYNANGGSGAPDAITVDAGSTTLSSTVPTRTGYNFLGWSTSSTATTAPYSAGSNYNVTESVTLYAVWQAIVTNINANRYTCEGDKRFATYYVTTCTATTCTYTKKNGLDSSYSFTLDTSGTPAWSIDTLANTLYTDAISVDTITSNGNTCCKQTERINTSAGLNCRAAADTSASVVTAYDYSSDHDVYRTTMQIQSDGSVNWYYSPEDDCYISGDYLTTVTSC